MNEVKGMHGTNSSSWAFHNPVELIFGEGCLNSALPALQSGRILLITTPGMVRRGTVDEILKLLSGCEVVVCDQVLPNPDMATLDALAEEYRRMKPFDLVLGLGGGSAIDTAKIIAFLLGTPADFTLEAHFVAGRSLPEQLAPLPVVAIPTTSGTGSEVTPFATVWDTKAKKKYSLASDSLFPKKAILDPCMTYGLPWDTTLYTGLDALCQACESIWNRNANPLTLNHAMHAAKLAWDALHHGENILEQKVLRRKMMEASLFAGLAISHTRTALCHSMSYPITSHYGIPHGLACGFTMPAVLEFNNEYDDGRLAALAVYLGSDHAESLAERLYLLFDLLHLKDHLGKFKIPARLPDEIFSKMIAPGRADNNLRQITVNDIRQFFQNIYIKLF